MVPKSQTGLFSAMCVTTDYFLMVGLVCLLHILCELLLEILAKKRNITDMAAYFSVTVK